ncbi:hypothetical protein [Micromonospora auratinigra]|uniref:Uncharacterized protein n=1 Tax=Micromonospora auratinigra TaxID=261654 RepID=A0A1A9A369_9ACTN|nr:hypothetical protein [Micromonospora auratinigra]SBT50537.1 hypothetical protein GA0070611_4807 [Micromonospora auratinigra]
MGHVFARLTGYGMVLVPNWPYRFERQSDGSDDMRVTRWTPDGPRHVVVRPGHPVDAGDVVEVTHDPDQGAQWFIETSLFRTVWPPDFTVESSHDPDDHTAFYLHGSDESMIFPQGPVPRARLNDPAALVAAGQTIIGSQVGDDGISVVELAYEHDAEPWWQGYWLVEYSQDHFLVITAQARQPQRADTRAAAAAVAASLAVGPPRG